VSDSTPKQGGQSDHTIRCATSNMTPVPDRSICTRTQFIDSKQTTPTAFDPCTLAGVPTMHQIYSATPVAVVLMNSLPQN
jgi:hypothetical protein